MPNCCTISGNSSNFDTLGAIVNELSSRTKIVLPAVNRPPIHPPAPPSARSPACHGLDNNPCSQRLRGKKLIICPWCEMNRTFLNVKKTGNDFYPSVMSMMGGRAVGQMGNYFVHPKNSAPNAQNSIKSI